MTDDPIEFGTKLIDTLDLDPVYVALEGITDPAQKARACVAYWFYYHLGVAAKLSEAPGPDFWKAVEGVLETAPRGTERRHFRGLKASVAVRLLRARFLKKGVQPLIESLTAPETAPPCGSKAQEAVSAPQARGKVPPPPSNAALRLRREGRAGPDVRDRTPLTFGTVRERVLELPMFGPWIAFKVGDMLERVLKTPVDFQDCNLLEFYVEPREGAELAAKLWKLSTPQKALDRITRHFREKEPTWAPPSNNRMVNIQEIETILCKWKAYLNGHYEIGKDTLEVVHGLHSYPSATGEKLLQALEARSPFLLRRKARALV